MYSMAAIALLAGGGGRLSAGFGGGNSLRRAPMMKKKMPMPMAEIKSESLRPSESTRKNTRKAVDMTFMIP